MASGPRRHRITVDDYYRMAEVGVLAPDARVELIEGEIIDMAPIGSEHASVVDQLAHLLVRAAGDSAIVRVQGSVRLSHITEPEPDVAVLKPRPDLYRHAHPTGPEILLLIEVSETSLRYDCDIKMPLYALHGVAETWIIDLQHNRVLCFSGLENGEYRAQTSTDNPGIVTLTALPELRIDLSTLLEPR